jgi:hypothetical protein
MIRTRRAASAQSGNRLSEQHALGHDPGIMLKQGDEIMMRFLSHHDLEIWNQMIQWRQCRQWYPAYGLEYPKAKAAGSWVLSHERTGQPR